MSESTVGGSCSRLGLAEIVPADRSQPEAVTTVVTRRQHIGVQREAQARSALAVQGAVMESPESGSAVVVSVGRSGAVVVSVGRSGAVVVPAGG